MIKGGTTEQLFYLCHLPDVCACVVAMCVTVNSNGLDGDCCEKPAAREPKKKQKKQNDLPEEQTTTQQTPLKKKKKKKRKLTDSTESPGKKEKSQPT